MTQITWSFWTLMTTLLFTLLTSWKGDRGLTSVKRGGHFWIKTFKKKSLKKRDKGRKEMAETGQEDLPLPWGRKFGPMEKPKKGVKPVPATDGKREGVFRQGHTYLGTEKALGGQDGGIMEKTQ